MPTLLAIELARGEFEGALLDAVVRGLRAGVLVREYGGSYAARGEVWRAPEVQVTYLPRPHR
jgi:hypothetical protein